MGSQSHEDSHCATASHLENVGEYVILQGGIVHPDRAASDFCTIQDEIVMLSPNLRHRISTQGPRRWPIERGTHLVDMALIQRLDILPHGGRERMVGAGPSATRQKVLVWI